MDDTFPAGSLLHEQGWRQGAYIACSNLSEKILANCRGASQELEAKQLSDPRNVLILLSQACDIVASCNKESTLEFVIARRPKKKSAPHGANLDARSSRFLELKLNYDNWYKAEAAKIIHVPKQIFYEEVKQQTQTPLHLDEHDIEVLARWRANRYMRIALPDSFVNKINPLIRDGLFDSGLDHAGGLYLQLDPYSESDEYIVRLFALHRRGSPIETFEPLFNKMETILEAINEITGLSCPFIAGENISFYEEVFPAMRRNEVSIELRDHFVRWNFDYISLKTQDSPGIDDA